MKILNNKMWENPREQKFGVSMDVQLGKETYHNMLQLHVSKEVLLEDNSILSDVAVAIVDALRTKDMLITVKIKNKKLSDEVVRLMDDNSRLRTQNEALLTVVNKNEQNKAMVKENNDDEQEE